MNDRFGWKNHYFTYSDIPMPFKGVLRVFWLEEIVNFTYSAIPMPFKGVLRVIWLEEIANFTYSAIPTRMPFKGVSLYVMSLKGEWGWGAVYKHRDLRQGRCQIANFRTRGMKYKP